MEISSASQEGKDRISELPDDIVLNFVSLLEMKNAAHTSIISRRWRYLWTYSTHLDFDPELMYPEEFATFMRFDTYETSKYFAWINQVVNMHQGPSVDKFRVHSRYVSSYAIQLDKWVKFAFSKRVKELELNLVGSHIVCPDHSERGFPLGFDILKHPPCDSGITALKSLHLQYVDASKDFIEFLLSHCVHLERLFLHTVPLSSIKIKTSRLKYLSIITRFVDLEEIEIEAENLLYFEYDDGRSDTGGPHMVFKCLPMLVETNFRGGFCRYPFPIFEKLSHFTRQLCKLSFHIDPEYHLVKGDLFIPDGAIPTFPNVKHFTCTSECNEISCIRSMIRFIEACPMLEEFKLQVEYSLKPEGSREATKLQEVDVKNGVQKVETEIGFKLENDEELEYALENVKDEKRSHPNLRILELVGFLGTDCDVGFALAVVIYARSLETIICDPQAVRYTGSIRFWRIWSHKENDAALRRARKLAKIVAPKVNVVIIQ